MSPSSSPKARSSLWLSSLTEAPTPPSSLSPPSLLPLSVSAPILEVDGYCSGPMDMKGEVAHDGKDDTH